MSFDYYAAFDRHIGLLTRDEMERVRTFHIGIAGQGGVGGNYLLALTRMGFEHFTILDHDAFDESNLNRQVGATAQTLGRRKVEVGEEMAASINPNVKVRSVAEPFGPATVDLFFDGIDFAINAIDYLSAPVYGLLHDTARARGLYSLTVSPFGFGASMTVFGPQTPSFADCVGVRPEDDEVTTIRKFWAAVTPARLPQAYLPPGALTPEPPKERIRISSLAPCIYLATALASTEVLVTLLGKRPPILAPNVLQIDLLSRAMAVTSMDVPAALADAAREA
ncbi:MAG: ThiF family adenylyltransferase [Egibacteraceae bacterium]